MPRTSRLRLSSQGVKGQAQRTGLSNRRPADKSGPAGYGYAEGFLLTCHLYNRLKTNISKPCVIGWTGFDEPMFYAVGPWDAENIHPNNKHRRVAGRE